MKQAYVSEIFPSIQGEGIYIGIPQVFIRFSGCNLRCNFCDTVFAQQVSSVCKIYPLLKKPFTIKNPISPNQLKEIIEDYRNYKYNSISLTGGEPLLQVDFLDDFLHNINSKIYLETNGIKYKALKKIINRIDIIAMDIKLPSQVQGKSYFLQHKKFLNLATKKNVFVKIILTNNIDIQEFKLAIKTIYSVSPYIPVVLQLPYKEKINFEIISKYINIAKEKLQDVRFIPQMHKYIKAK